MLWSPYLDRTTVIGILNLLCLYNIFLCLDGNVVLVRNCLFAFVLCYRCYNFTRIRAESGLPVHNFEGIDFWTNLPLVFGFRNLGNRNLASSMVSKWAETGDLNFHPMPHQLEGFKMVNQVHANRRHFMIAMLIAVVLSCLYSIQIGSRKLGFNSLKIIGSDML